MLVHRLNCSLCCINNDSMKYLVLVLIHLNMFPFWFAPFHCSKEVWLLSCFIVNLSWSLKLFSLPTASIIFREEVVLSKDQGWVSKGLLRIITNLIWFSRYTVTQTASQYNRLKMLFCILDVCSWLAWSWWCCWGQKANSTKSRPPELPPYIPAPPHLNPMAEDPHQHSFSSGEAWQRVIHPIQVC